MKSSGYVYLNAEFLMPEKLSQTSFTSPTCSGRPKTIGSVGDILRHHPLGSWKGVAKSGAKVTHEPKPYVVVVSMCGVSWSWSWSVVVVCVWWCVRRAVLCGVAR